MNRIILIGIIVVILLLLAGGGYTAVQLLAGPENETATAGGGARVMESIQVGNDGIPVNVQTTILPAAELPDEETAAFGIVLNRRDDVLTIGTGAIDISVDIEVDPNTGQETTTVIPSTNGPELEIVLSRDTQIYRDITDIAGQMPDKSGEVTITQEIRLADNAGKIDENMEVQVWGERRGDRIVADVVVFGPLAGGAFE